MVSLSLLVTVAAVSPAGAIETQAERFRNDVLRKRDGVDLQILQTRQRRQEFREQQQRFREEDRGALRKPAAPVVKVPRRTAPCRGPYDGNSYLRACR